MRTGAGILKCRCCLWLRRLVFQPLCGELLFNSEMSLEIDRLLQDDERVKSVIGSTEAVKK